MPAEMLKFPFEANFGEMETSLIFTLISCPNKNKDHGQNGKIMSVPNF